MDDTEGVFEDVIGSRARKEVQEKETAKPRKSKYDKKNCLDGSFLLNVQIKRTTKNGIRVEICSIYPHPLEYVVWHLLTVVRRLLSRI